MINPYHVVSRARVSSCPQAESEPVHDFQQKKIEQKDVPTQPHESYPSGSDELKHVIERS